MKGRWARMVAAVVLLTLSVVFGAGTAPAQTTQAVGIALTQASIDAANQAIAAGHFGAELTPTQEGVSKGSSAFMRLGETANVTPPEGAVSPFVNIPKPSWGPVDLGYFQALPTTAHTLNYTRQWNVYLGCNANNQSCWGNPEQFISDLNTSAFIHVVDQYVGIKKLKRYPLASPPLSDAAVSGTVTFNDTLVLLGGAVSTAAGFAGETPASVSGPGNIYHLYFNAGIDVCIDANTCYSPDNLSTFAFCGYHAYADFGPPYNRVYFTVEPYQPVPGCFSSAPDLTSATANVLSHEIFEAITDPDLDAWYGTGYPLGNYGEEIGDQCVWVNIYPQKLKAGHQAYYTQNEYSNKYHSCVNRP